MIKYITLWDRIKLLFYKKQYSIDAATLDGDKTVVLEYKTIKDKIYILRSYEV
jgi:hypothetical protein